MKVAVFSSKRYDRASLTAANQGAHTLKFFEPHLDASTVSLAQGYDTVCIFVNDSAPNEVIQALARFGVKLIALRCAGFNNVDLASAAKLGIPVARVPAYSPYAVAEHAVGMILALNRQIPRAYNRVREGNFALEGLMGFDLRGKTVGVIGTGKIGTVFAKIMLGFGCRVLAHDVVENPECVAAGIVYKALPEVLQEADITSLHCPLTPATRHLINKESIRMMKSSAMLVNTSRGALVDTVAVIDALKLGKLGYLALDVYEEEEGLFFEDMSGAVLQDDVFARLLTFPNVLITGHQAFFTHEALDNIAATTIGNITEFEHSGYCTNSVSVQK